MRGAASPRGSARPGARYSLRSAFLTGSRGPRRGGLSLPRARSHRAFGANFVLEVTGVTRTDR
jgi:hypothetical protein